MTILIGRGLDFKKETEGWRDENFSKCAVVRVRKRSRVGKSESEARGGPDARGAQPEGQAARRAEARRKPAGSGSLQGEGNSRRHGAKASCGKEGSQAPWASPKGVEAPVPQPPTNDTISGGNGEGVPPVPIPNTEVKPFSADGTWLETAREIRSLPDSIRILERVSFFNL